MNPLPYEPIVTSFVSLLAVLHDSVLSYVGPIALLGLVLFGAKFLIGYLVDNFRVISDDVPKKRIYKSSTLEDEYDKFVRDNF